MSTFKKPTHSAKISKISNARPLDLLPGVPETLVRKSYASGARNKLDSGELYRPDSSAALVANTFGWFLERPLLIPPLPGLEGIQFNAESVELERRLQYPWSGGRHPIFDAIVETDTHIIAIESKRGEQFREKKRPRFSEAFDRDLWGQQMGPYLNLRDQLRSGEIKCRYLDAPRLVKRALALFAESQRIGKIPILYYLSHDPHRVDNLMLTVDEYAEHISEVQDFLERARGAQVMFHGSTYNDLFSEWEDQEGHVKRHGDNVFRYLYSSQVMLQRCLGRH